jgi:hypothetical protein
VNFSLGTSLGLNPTLHKVTKRRGTLRSLSISLPHCRIFVVAREYYLLNFDALILTEDISDTTYHRLGTLVFLFFSVYFYGPCAQACGGNNTAIQHRHCNVLL